MIGSVPKSSPLGVSLAFWVNSAYDSELGVSKQVRALPSNPASNDILKVEYLDVNLNNSRKLMGNIANLTSEAKRVTEQEESTVESMLRLKNLRSELSWTDSVH